MGIPEKYLQEEERCPVLINLANKEKKTEYTK